VRRQVTGVIGNARKTAPEGAFRREACALTRKRCPGTGFPATASFALIVGAAHQVSGILRSVFALSNLAILVFAVLVLAWFFYSVILRKILRARGIANARMKRMMREAGERQDRSKR
jgi:hypothetical protein